MRRSSVLWLLGLITLLLPGGCGDAEPLPQHSAAQEVRIVSLSPAISRTLVDLDMADRVVGRTPFCESLDPALPEVGDLLNLDYERLVRLRPTHVLVQPPVTGIDRRLLELAASHGWEIGRWRLDDIADVKNMIAQLPEALSDDALIEPAVHLELLIDEALRGDGDHWKGRTILVAGTDPVGVFGTGTYLHDVLTSLGASNAVTMQHYPQLTLEDVTRINPQAVILIRPGAPSDLDPLAAMRSLARLQIDAVRDGRVAVLTHPDAFLPSSGIIGVAEEMRAILRRFTDDSPRRDTGDEP